MANNNTIGNIVDFTTSNSPPENWFQAVDLISWDEKHSFLKSYHSYEYSPITILFLNQRYDFLTNIINNEKTKNTIRFVIHQKSEEIWGYLADSKDKNGLKFMEENGFTASSNIFMHIAKARYRDSGDFFIEHIRKNQIKTKKSLSDEIDTAWRTGEYDFFSFIDKHNLAKITVGKIEEFCQSSFQSFSKGELFVYQDGGFKHNKSIFTTAENILDYYINHKKLVSENIFLTCAKSLDKTSKVYSPSTATFYTRLALHCSQFLKSREQQMVDSSFSIMSNSISDTFLPALLKRMPIKHMKEIQNTFIEQGNYFSWTGFEAINKLLFERLRDDGYDDGDLRSEKKIKLIFALYESKMKTKSPFSTYTLNEQFSTLNYLIKMRRTISEFSMSSPQYVEIFNKHCDKFLKNMQFEFKMSKEDFEEIFLRKEKLEAFLLKNSQSSNDITIKRSSIKTL